MPIYAINCACGCGELITFGSERHAWGDTVRCPECGELCTVHVAPSNVAGLTTGRGFYSAQADRVFQNAREADAWAAARGLVAISPKSETWRRIKYDAREDHEDMVRGAGFRDVDDKRRNWDRRKGEILRAAQEREIETYHDEHGSEGRQTPEQAFPARPAKEA